MTTRHREEFTAPVQLESLLEVPVKIILIEDLIREKSALASSELFQSTGLDSPSKNTETNEENASRTGRDAFPAKKCLFDCCATPSRWRDTDCYSNNSHFRTANIALPWHDTLAVIPVMQVEKANVEVSSIVDVSTNEDTDTDIEMNNKNSDDERIAEKRLSPDEVPLSLTTPSKTPQFNQANNSNNNSDKDITLTKQSNSEPKTSQPEKVASTNSQPVVPSSLSPTVASAVVVPTASTSATLLGKVTEKPTRYEDFIIAHGSNTSSSNNKSGNTITTRKGQDVIRDTDNVSQGSNNSADDTLKLTFYNETRKEPSKEYHGAESGGSSASDIRYFENQGLQMSRIVREAGGSNGSEGNARVRQEPILVENLESRSTDKVCNNDNTQNYCKNPNPNNNTNNNSNSSYNLSAASSSTVITQPQQLRLTSSIIQNLNNNNNAKNSNNVSNNNSGPNNTTQQGRQWEGLQISRCQKEVNSVITLDGESSSNGSVGNREINTESSLNTNTNTTSISNPPESKKGENENSIERHLQTYLTSLRYVKPAEGDNEKCTGQEGENGNKDRTPLTSPQSRHAPSNMASPIISPHTRSPGSGGGQGGVTRTPNIQRVSPSQQASSLESWPERTIARIPTRPFLRRNTTYEQQHHQPPHQQHQLVSPRPPYHPPHIQQQQPRMIAPTTSIIDTTPRVAAPTTPLHSPPKRFKSATLPAASPVLPPHHHPHPQPQHYQQGVNTVNRYSHVSNTVTTSQQQYRNSNTPAHDHPQQMQLQQYQRPSTATSSNLARMSNQQPYSNMPNYNQHQNQSSTQHIATASTVSNFTQSPHVSPASVQLYAQQSQHPQYHNVKCAANTNPQGQQQHHQQQLQFQRHIQESLLIASTAMTSSSEEPVDSSYSERLRRYCEFYHKQELDVSKLQEYYKKYGFYPWDILTARDESIIRQMKTQEQQQVLNMQHTEVREVQSSSIARCETVRRIDVENATLHQQYQQQHNQRQMPVRTMNLANSPGRVVPNFSPSQQPQTMVHSTVVAGHAQSGMVSGRVSVVPQPIVSPQVPASNQNRYNHNNIQQLNHKEYGVHQQQMNRYYQTHQQQQRDHQNYRHNQEIHHHQHQQQPRTVEQDGHLRTNYDIQNSPQYRSAYNQLAAAAAAVSSVAGSAAATASQTQLRTDSRAANTGHPVRDERVGHILHSQSGVGNRPIVMTVADPVPAPPEAIPLSIHRQALEQAIKNNQITTSSGLHGGVNANRDDINCRREQRRSPHPPPTHPHHASHTHQMSHGQPIVVGRARSESVTVGMGMHGTNKEPLRVVPSPTLAHQTSVIRRIQQQGSPPSTVSALASGSHQHRGFISDRPGISYRRISDGSSTDSNGAGGGPPLGSAFMYQQQKDQRSLHAQHQHQHPLYNSSAQQHPIATTLPIRRNIVPFHENGQGIPRATPKRRIIITDNNGVNQNLTERCSGVVTSPIPLIAGEEEVITTNVSPSDVRATLNDELPEDDDRPDSIAGGGWQYDHVVLLDKRIKTYMCKRCFETLKTEQQIRNHLFCKMLANHVQCHVCLQLITSDTYPSHLQIHGVRPPDNIQIDN